MDKKYILGLLIGLVVIGMAAIIFKSDKPTQRESEKLQVVASFYPLYFFASEIGGDKATVTNITPAGAEPHEYEPTAQDMAKIENSDVVILNGGGLEPWGESVQINLKTKKALLVVAGESLADKEIVEEGEKMTDPHIWLSPKLALKMVEKIGAGFAQADLPNKDYYLSNTEKLKTELSQLDETYQAGLNNCAQKDIITSHIAFAYLAQAYGLNQIGISGLSTENEPTAKEMTDIVKFAKDNNVKYIFFESLVSPKLSETMAEEVGAKTLVLNPIEGLTKEDIASGKNYFTEMKNNLTNLQTALECKTS